MSEFSIPGYGAQSGLSRSRAPKTLVLSADCLRIRRLDPAGHARARATPRRAMFTISASSTAARPTVVAHRRANKTRAKRSVVVHGAKVRERASARRARATRTRARVIARGAIGRVILDDDGVGRGANAMKRTANARGSFVASRARVAARARASTGGRRTGRGDGDRAGRILEGFGARARGADESDV